MTFVWMLLSLIVGYVIGWKVQLRSGRNWKRLYLQVLPKSWEWLTPGSKLEWDGERLIVTEVREIDAHD